MNKKVWLLLWLCIFIDFLSTLIGVGLLGYYEINNLTRYLFEIKDYWTMAVLDLIVFPVFFYGFYNFYPKIFYYIDNSNKFDKYKKWLIYGVLLSYIPFLVNNLILIMLAI